MKYDRSVIALRSFLVGILLAGPVVSLAQTSVTNEAFITPPTTVIDPISSNNQDAETNPVVPFAPALVTNKSLTSNVDEDGSGNVTLGDTLTYTLTVTNAGNVTLTGVTLVDSLIATLNCVPAQPATLDPAGQLTCTGSYEVQPGDVTAGQVVNTATGDSDQTGPDNDQVTTPVFGPEVSVSKTANPASGSSVTAGQTISYTLTAVVTDAALTSNLDLSDTLDADLTFGSVTNAGAFTPNTAGNPLVFTLPSGTTPGSYSVTYTATVNNDAIGTVGNSVVVTGPGGDPDPQCSSCTTNHPLADPQVSVTKASNPASGTNVTAGQTITYTLTAVVADAALTVALDLSDTLDADLTFGSVTNPGAFSANTAGNPLVFTLPAGTTPGSYSVTYTATVNNDAIGTVGNSVVVTDPGGDPDPQCPSCTTSHPLADPQVSVTKASNPASGTNVTAGQTISYTLTAVVTDAALTSNLDLSDTLDAHLTFGSVTNNPDGFAANTVGNPVVFTLPSGTTPGSYSVTYTATVNNDAAGTVGNSVVITGSGGDPDPQCPSCTTSHPLADPQVSVTKASNPTSGTSVAAGQTITYTLTAVVTDAALTSNLDLSDTLDADLTFGSVTNAGAFTPNIAGNPLVFTLPSGTTPGSYSVTYTATVNNDATGTVGNSVVITGPGGDPDPQCPSCTTNHPLADPQVSVTKAANPASGAQVSAGQTITYTLTVMITDAALTATLDLSDTLDADLTFGSVTNPGAFSANTAGNPLVFTLPSGTTPGSYSVAYTATVNNDATGTVGNSVVITGQGGDPDPQCPSCSTNHPVGIPDLMLVKQAVLDDTNGNGFADAGEDIDYTLTATNTGNVTLTDVTIIDPLIGTLSCIPTQPATLAPAAALVCTGTYTVTQPNVDAGGSIVNTATASAPDPFDPVNNPPLTDEDATSTPVVPVPGLELVKAAQLDDSNGNTFADLGETINYTLTATNIGNLALTDVVIADPLIEDQPAVLNCVPAQPAALAPAEQLVCTGSYLVSQNDLDAGPDIVNIATVMAPDPIDPINNPPLGDDDTTTTPTAFDATIELTKVITSGNPYVNVNDVITYELIATNTGNVTLSDAVISDPQAVLGGCTPAQPATLLPGETLICQATYQVGQPEVNAGSFTNIAEVDARDPNDQLIEASDSATATGPAATPILNATKQLTSNADEDGSGNVTLGDTLTYTLTVTNAGNVTLTGVTLVDSLIATLNCVPAQPATLDPAGQLVCTGDYVVQADDVTAGQIVNTATGDSDQTGSDNDQVTTPVFGPEVSVSKTANPASGSSVTAGQTISYTLTAVISDAPLTAALDLSDTLDADLTFGSVTSAGAFTPNTAGNPLVFTLPAGTSPGGYSVTYTATVNNDASGTVGNSVVITGPGGDPDPQCSSCTTNHPLADPQVSVTKAANPASGSTVTAGQTITYTLTATITDAALTATLDLSDTLDADLTFGSVTNAGAFSANTVDNPLVFTLPSGTIPGSYSVAYTATVNNDASGTVGNNVIITGPGGDPDPQCPSCTTNHPLADPQASVTKASDPVSGTSVTAGQTITYTLTAVVTDAALTSNLDLSDTLDADLTFGSVTNAGAFSANTVGNPLVFTLPSGTTPGSYSVTYTATVNSDATGTVGNSVVITGSGGDPDPQCPSCTTSHRLADPQVSVTKASNPTSGTSVAAGQTITYTLTAVVTDAALTSNLDLSDTLDADLTFGSVTNAGAFTPNIAGNPLVFTLPSGTTPGSYSVTYTATVNNDATGTVGNSVVITGSGGDPDPECPSCTTSHPVFNMLLDKSVTGLTSTGPNRWLVSFELSIESIGDADGIYTLFDTLNFTGDGILIGETATVSSIQGSLNPAIASGVFTPQNGTPLQLSAAGLVISAGAQHRYFIEIPFSVVEGQLQNGQCSGAPGNGLFNSAILTGPVQAEDNACASIDEGSDVAINLLKTVELGIDNNGNNFGDVGDVLFYTFQITNTDIDPLTDIQLIDLLVNDLTCAPQTTDGEPIQVLPWDGISIRGFERGGLGTLNAGKVLVCAASHTLTADDVARRRVENTATVLGTGPLGEVVSSVSTAVYTAFQ